MSAVTIAANGRSWGFAPVTQPLDAARLQIIARATVLDDRTLSPPRGLSAATTGTFATQVGPDGLVGLIGRPTWTVPPAQLPGLGVSLTVSAEGCQDAVLAGALPPQPGLPASFAALDLGTYRLIRLPVVICGRVFRRQAGIFVPLAGAEVRVVAASPVPALAGAMPAPVPVGALVGTSAFTNPDGEYRFAPFQRFATLRLQVVAPVSGPPVEIGPPLGEITLVQDFRLG